MGYLGQRSYDRIGRWQMERASVPSKPITQRIAESKWIPFRKLADDEYMRILHEKLLSIEAEIALVDERIEELQRRRKTQESDGDKPGK